MVGSGQPYKAMELELKARVMGPMGAILSATRENSKLMKREKQIGTLEAGKCADILLVRGNPLDDVALFQNRENLFVIMQDGCFVKKKL